MKVKVDTILAAVLMICAVMITAVVVRRELVSSPNRSVTEERFPMYVKDWRADLAPGVTMGSSGAPVQVIEFGDFECSFCQEFRKTFKSVQERYPRQIDLIFVHFPLPGHRFAILAARVAECAGEQGRFEAMHDQLFEHQDDFGLRPWSDFAVAAGVPDMGAFEGCIKRADPIPRVEEGRALGNKLDIQGTPTIVINGWKLGRPPTSEELDHMVKAILAGNSPVG